MYFPDFLQAVADIWTHLTLNFSFLGIGCSFLWMMNQCREARQHKGFRDKIRAGVLPGPIKRFDTPALVKKIFFKIRKKGLHYQEKYGNIHKLT